MAGLTENALFNEASSEMVSTALDWRSAQSVPRLAPHDSWDRLQTPRNTELD